MRMQVKLWIGRQRGSGIEKEREIGKSCRNEKSARALAASNQEVTAAAVYCEEIKRMIRLPCPAQTDAPWMFTCRAEI
jgi:hypothetical protein